MRAERRELKLEEVARGPGAVVVCCARWGVAEEVEEVDWCVAGVERAAELARACWSDSAASCLCSASLRSFRFCLVTNFVVSFLTSLTMVNRASRAAGRH